MQEQRATPRFRVDLNVRWETLKSQGRGAVTDLSSGGCFILTGGEVLAGELVRLQVTSSPHIANVWGHVIYAISEMGFALRFVSADEAGNEELKKLMRNLQPVSD